MKDFLFSHEPSSWRFDVEETLNTESFEPDASPTHYISRSPHTEQPNRVIDFTDDATGAPHEVAQSHVSMYVNEVGHDATLVENIDVSYMCVLIHCYFMTAADRSRFLSHRRWAKMAPSYITLILISPCQEETQLNFSQITR